MKLLSRVVLLFVLLPASLRAWAQHSDSPNYARQMSLYQDSLVSLSYRIVNDASGPERMNANYSFTRTLVRALKTPHSFNFPFDSLKSITIRYSPDRKFRVITWSVMFDDGSYRFYGTVQMNTVEGKLKMYGLTDFSPAMKNAGDTVTSAERWYGAQYYKIIPVYNARSNYYLLLGWKGNTQKTTKKVIDVLSFKDDKPVFGMPVFDGIPKAAGAKRIIFEYSRQVSMKLDYMDNERTIVFDHLAPRDPKLEGQFEFYGPDFSYDGLKLLADRWKLVADLPLKNPPSADDLKFNDPKKPVKGAKRAFY